MSIHEQFIPGQWVDAVDVNDFINLNKKPFSQEPIFLKKDISESVSSFYQNVVRARNEQRMVIELDFSSLESADSDWLKMNFTSNPFVKKVGYSENLSDMKSAYRIASEPERTETRKTAYQLFEEVATSEIKKMLKMNLFSNNPVSYSPFFLHPDVRIIPLYGTKRLIKEKRWTIKTLEKHLQTHEWMQRRIALHKEIEAVRHFEKFCEKLGFDLSEPAKTSEEVLQYIFLTLSACMIENPSIPFSLANILPFVDVYMENDMRKGGLAEEKAQELIDVFYLKLSFIRFALSSALPLSHPKYPHFFGETFGGDYVAKTTYRFLAAVEKFDLFPFAVRIIWNKNYPEAFKNFCDSLAAKKIPLTVLDAKLLKNKKNIGVFPHGQFGVASEELAFDAGVCDLERLLYLSLNGGKDVNQNINISPITQPLRNPKPDFDEIFAKFKEMLSYILSSYVELMNIVVYLNEIQNYHPLRSSLMNYMTRYRVQFGFTKLSRLSSLLSAAQNGSFETIKDKDGWVGQIAISDGGDDEMMTAKIIALIETEIAKIPLYKNGKANTRFYDKGVFDLCSFSEISKRTLPPADLIKSVFNANIVLGDGESSLQSIAERLFAAGYGELNFSYAGGRSQINAVMYE